MRFDFKISLSLLEIGENCRFLDYFLQKFSFSSRTRKQISTFLFSLLEIRDMDSIFLFLFSISLFGISSMPGSVKYISQFQSVRYFAQYNHYSFTSVPSASLVQFWVFFYLWGIGWKYKRITPFGRLLSSTSVGSSTESLKLLLNFIVLMLSAAIMTCGEKIFGRRFILTKNCNGNQSDKIILHHLTMNLHSWTLMHSFLVRFPNLYFVSRLGLQYPKSR